MKEHACIRCKFITTESVCPNCGSTEFSENWSGVVYIIKPEESYVAKLINAKKSGMYAIKIR